MVELAIANANAHVPALERVPGPELGRVPGLGLVLEPVLGLVPALELGPVLGLVLELGLELGLGPVTSNFGTSPTVARKKSKTLTATLARSHKGPVERRTGAVTAGAS